MLKIFYGSVISPTDLRAVDYSPRCLLAVNETSGVIEWLEPDVPDSLVQNTMASKGYIDVDVYKLRSGEFLMPGFIDTHTHAPQFPNIGSGQQYELLDWLNNCTFPTEAKFKDVNFARKVYKSVIERSLRLGTTTSCYYATLHSKSTKLLADLAHELGQRCYVGKCNMDSFCPPNYVELSVEDSIEATKDVIDHIRSIPHNSLVKPILTPRFAVSCSTHLLSELGKLALTDPNLAIQTHISENKSEIELVRTLFPSHSSYADVYDSHNLLRSNTILAHACHLTPDEVELVKKRKAGISHCPTSNFNLRSGMTPVGALLDAGIKVGLGTDCSGGFSPSMLTAVQHASICSKVVAMEVGVTMSDGFAGKQLPVEALLYLATMGGAALCCSGDWIGSLEVGKEFDALLVSLRPELENPLLWSSEPDEPDKGDDNLPAMLERFLFCGDDRNIRQVYVKGRLVSNHH